MADFRGYYVYTEPPVYDLYAEDPSPVDLRSSDLTMLDLSKSRNDLLNANFDSKTQWPPSNKMPFDFDWQKIMETNKDPGLGIQVLHEQAITGKGIGIAIVDQPLLVDHHEYVNQLRLYEEINVTPEENATMHGAAVTSIAVGKTVGIAPDADLYYIGSWTGDWDPATEVFTWNFKYYAQAIHRILEINQNLPKQHKIRVIAMQV
jgi:subtilisin family serine protease